jgi:hypothetical protein
MRGYSILYTSGIIDEVAIFNYALTSGQISTLYSTGTSSSGGHCRSSTGYFQGLWNNFSGMISGTSAQLFVNGRQECSVSANNGYLTPASNLLAGRTASATKGWIGYLADLLLYGTSDGSAVATASNIKTNFDATADRYRQTPIGNIVTNGLVLNLDAANAKQGLRPFANGCASTDLNWFDLSSSVLTGSLNGFTSCSSVTGWNGNGTTTISGNSGPYRLSFDGTDDYVDLGTLGNLGSSLGSISVSFSFWINTTYTSALKQIGTINTGNNTLLTINFNRDADDAYSAGKTSLAVRGDGGAYLVGAMNTNIYDGGWHHVYVSRTNGAASITFYVDGTLVPTNYGSFTGSPSVFSNFGNSFTIGASNVRGVISNFMPSEIAQFSIYNRELSYAEISRNCNALKIRFAGASCN